MGVHNRSDLILFRDVPYQPVYDHRSLRIEAGIGFVTKKIFWIQNDRSRNAHPFFHPTTKLCGKFFIGVLEIYFCQHLVDPFQICAV